MRCSGWKNDDVASFHVHFHPLTGGDLPEEHLRMSLEYSYISQRGQSSLKDRMLVSH